MMRNAILFAFLCSFSLFGFAAQTQAPVNVEGKWTLIVHHPDPKKYFTEALSVRQNGAKLIGEFWQVYPKLESDTHSVEGIVDGNKIAFDVWHHSTSADGTFTSNNTFTYYRGTVEGDTMSGTGNVGGADVTWMARKGVTGQFKEGKF